ncbi:MAG: AraC family ligand binding domain-containing protein, partial [Victivallales bacterium]|nr:AraC family ligand binding domain-containing protein [Victivallales bacterium]
MKTPIQEAYGKHYFASAIFPLAIREVPSSNLPQHPYDLTEIEHYHNFSELVIITKGRGCQLVNGIEYQVVAGDVFLIQGFSAHRFKSRQTLSHINLMFAPNRLPLPIDYLRKIPGYNVIFCLEPSLRSRTSYKHRLHLEVQYLVRLENLVRKLRNELDAQNQGYEAAAFTLLMEIIIFISYKYDSKLTQNAAALIRLGKIISLLENNFTAPWTLEKLAKQATMSVNNLLLLFRSATGSSPIDYLIKVRLR